MALHPTCIGSYRDFIDGPWQEIFPGIKFVKDPHALVGYLGPIILLSSYQPTREFEDILKHLHERGVLILNVRNFLKYP